MDRDKREKHRERLNASPTQITERRRRKRGKVVTHSFQSGSLEQTAHRCREPELQETKKEEEDDETMSPGLSQQVGQNECRQTPARTTTNPEKYLKK